MRQTVERLIGERSIGGRSAATAASPSSRIIAPSAASWAAARRASRRSCSWACRRMVRARSSSDQDPEGQPASSGSSVVANSRTWSLCWGGKDRRPAGPGAVEQALEPVLGEAPPPAGNGVVVAAEFLGDAQVGGLVLV